MHHLIKKVNIVSPESPYHGKQKDILIKQGIIEKIGNNLSDSSAKIIEGESLYVSVGWMDIFAHFCDPGEEYKEDLESGIKVASAGGFTDICILPNTLPIVDGKAKIEYIKQNKGIVSLHPIGAVSKGILGKDLAEMYDMKHSGAIAFSDGLKPIQSTGLLLKALQYVKAFEGLIIQIPEDESIAKNGLINESVLSTELGMQGKPDIAESLLISRDIELAQYTNSHIHFTGISCKKSVELIRQAKKQGIQVSCSVSPYHLLFTEENLSSYNSIFKVNPPLRGSDDRKALLKGVEDGTIDCIASHHQPQDWDAKQCEFEYAKPGMITLQTMLPMLLQASNKIPLERWIEMLTIAPRKIFKVHNTQIIEKEKASLCVFATTRKWTFDESTNLSKSNNSPFWQQNLIGKVIAMFNQKEVRFYE
jgi:dihydroorotase